MKNSFYKNSHSLRQDCLWCAKEVCHALHDAHIAARMLRHSWIHLIISFPLRIGKEKISNTIIYSNLLQNRALSWQKQTPHSFSCGVLVLPVFQLLFSTRSGSLSILQMRRPVFQWYCREGPSGYRSEPVRCCMHLQVPALSQFLRHSPEKQPHR